MLEPFIKNKWRKKYFTKIKKSKDEPQRRTKKTQTRQTWTGEGERLYNTNGTPISSSLGISRQKKNRKKGGLGSRKPGRDWKKAMRGDGLKLKRTSLTMMKCQKIRNYSFI